jgi:hypothetical protein
VNSNGVLVRLQDSHRLVADPFLQVIPLQRYASQLKRFTPKGKIVSTPVKLSELLDAFDWVSASGIFENQAYIHRESGKVYWSSSTHEVEEELPEDIEDRTLYVAVPHKNEFDLGRSLALRFVEEQLPGSYDLVDGYFHKKGAYSRFKDLLERQGRLEAWYQYEAGAVERALRKWGEENGLQVGL